MTGKSLLLAIVALVVITAGFVFALQEKPAKLPPGIPPALWVPLTENSGIALKDTRYNLYGKPVFRGTLMVKVDGNWQTIYIQSSPGAMPLPLGE